VDGVAMFELNVSCSHANARFGRIGESVDHVKRLVTETRARTKRPIMVKLGWSPWAADLAVAAVGAGADAISATNSIGPGLDIDANTGRPRLGIHGGRGGVSGPAIFPLALACVSDIVQAVNVPVMGGGGVESGTDAIKMMMVGARAVQVYTAAMLSGPNILAEIAADMANSAGTRGLHCVAAFTGLSRPFLAEDDRFELKVPSLNPDQCNRWGNCASVCMSQAIVIVPVPQVDPLRCNGCGICLDRCPTTPPAIELP
jgi:dihydroorotate dehydrogenase/NAD-dependent dihydropyrimidine dehydrogenase PreA subunit